MTNIDRQSILIPESFHPSGEYADKLAILANCLMHLTAYDEDAKRGMFISFGKKHWERLFGTGYGPLREEAIRVGLIQPNNHYSAGNHPKYPVGFPKSLMLCDEHRNGAMKLYVLSRKRKIGSKRIDRESLGEIGMWLASHFDEVTLSECAAKTAKKMNPWSKFAYETVRRKEWRAKRCSKHRFHSNFTNIKKEIRKEILLDGTEVAAIDISSSQPTCLAILSKIKHHHAENWMNEAKQCCAICDADLSPWAADVEHWLELCAAGQLYEFFVDRFRAREFETSRRRTIDPAQMSRAQVKHTLIMAMFSKNNTMRRNPTFPVLERYFPTLADHLLKTKEINYKQMAWDCQCLEARLVIDGACGNLMEIEPNEPIITVHDEIICRPQHIGVVQSALTEQFARFGVTVSLKSKEGKGTSSTRGMKKNASPILASSPVVVPLPPSTEIHAFTDVSTFSGA